MYNSNYSRNEYFREYYHGKKRLLQRLETEHKVLKARTLSLEQGLRNLDINLAFWPEKSVSELLEMKKLLIKTNNGGNIEEKGI